MFYYCMFIFGVVYAVGVVVSKSCGNPTSDRIIVSSAGIPIGFEVFGFTIEFSIQSVIINRVAENFILFVTQLIIFSKMSGRVVGVRIFGIILLFSRSAGATSSIKDIFGGVGAFIIFFIL